MHFVSWFIMLGVLIGGLISREYMSVIGACVGMGLCSITDGLYFIGKTNKKEDTNNEESGDD